MRGKSVAAVAVCLASVGACGGDDEPSVMPQVEQRRLDIALSDIERSGFEDEVEVVGGGVFGVVDESNWQVCRQEPESGDEIGSTPRLVVERSCGKRPSEKASSPSESSTGQVQKSKPPRTVGGRGASDDAPFVMPALVGMNLQRAQDELQARGSFLLTQTDATGLERFQMLDANWKVCWQEPLPGTRTSVGRLVDLGAVKLNETCPAG